MLTAGSISGAAAAKSAAADLPRRKTASGTAYHEAGSGEPLVLIHGVGMRLEAWAPQIAFLSAGHRVIAVDMPGHGDSAKLPEGSRLEEFVAWFGRFLDEMAIETVNVAGHSMGALVSGGAAATFGERIRRVAYLNGVYRRDPQAKAAVLARAAAILVTGVDKDGPLARWFGDDPDSVVARELTRTWLNLVDPQGYAVAYAAFAGGDETYADRWKDVQGPALFLTGSDDPNSTPLMATQMAELAPRGYARIVEGHRHMVNLTAPDIVNSLLAEWLSFGEDER
ncbi:pimeloyl-ACP methyl ester carboxylesterase [Rhizobium leguminosarum]|uniref:Pimeloyl-ACP methyl ester carboxylesterase n=1 Tax=Rhizobium leguminosarum TaxID=384 RepID=A0AAE2MQV0_RHILE|nr:MULTISPECIES: alpha/beta fold hydrolase [Rhizobium]MBB4294211.1 pimeloyl-ACP methyl ester carboxylesterase [Rhizobium leguminosarum]MBB4300707.1 pimeloyl-ACP methyl ester carboxylesterase [Rhizobium leguminosarum]MBB4311981.1 pimeloyl-ACP methyl ester carboxylesterase [Rhizobium leguminosarum]MBB4421049.1 pimeloyl-ACP methyl ester carboxylesterase [Rhizobium leguminosarum]MBB4436237.1 pimeloyl-ACP methyl ester carboxylesterase [Rhizobium esperanzae]